MDEFVVFEALKKDEIKHIVRLQVRIGIASVSGLRRSSIHWSADNAELLLYPKIFAQHNLCSAELMNLSGAFCMAKGPREYSTYHRGARLGAFACACLQRAVHLLTTAVVRAG